ncbi:branched-chain amino acid ABC transporter permease [Paracraurococcus ruber]|uniref:Branched-chain amino acid ABC transporter permease n=1 Tax=Paracraurococcus ruber TaxID=77675 RepID=A0ABS1CW34_9PROT|nr:branched-chain amino acid ABC transporter permease [Paracraurococcus ruber]MBK1658614.1 branched-chain amino acid ABC transporter permease [Paracraurococcus ruber]TDG30813.1 branched-chain amino acid ABC transporter permease [Paracraurococcus ruber]
MLTVLVDGIASGMLLFVLAVGLSVTLGLMNFVNLAHGAFGMAGGYVCVVLLNRHGVPFVVCLLAAALFAALLGLLLERVLYRRLYGRDHLDQVLFSIGLVFIAGAVVDWFLGARQQLITLPAWLSGRIELGFVGIGVYRLFLIGLCGAIVLALHLGLVRTRFGSRLRAAVDDAVVARGLGIPVERLFAVTFALGSGLAGLGGALGVEVLGLDPTFPLKYMVYFLIVVAVGGANTVLGPFVAALLLGVVDVAGKYYVPQLGAFAIYTAMVVLLILRPQGLLAKAAAR